MGSGASRAAKAAPRKFPTRSAGAASPAVAAPQSRPQARSRRPLAASSKDEAILADSKDPDDAVSSDFSHRLRQMGVAQPQPTFSPTSTASPKPHTAPGSSLGPSYPSPANNPTLAALDARRRLQERAEAEFHDLGRKGSMGREFLDMNTIMRLLRLRESGASAANIEAQLHLKQGVVARLGPPGAIVPVAAVRS